MASTRSKIQSFIVHTSPFKESRLYSEALLNVFPFTEHEDGLVFLQHCIAGNHHARLAVSPDRQDVQVVFPADIQSADCLPMPLSRH